MGVGQLGCHGKSNTGGDSVLLSSPSHSIEAAPASKSGVTLIHCPEATRGTRDQMLFAHKKLTTCVEPDQLQTVAAHLPRGW